MNARRVWVPAAWHLLLVAVCVVYVVGALRAVPFTGTSDRDFELVREWRETGRLTAHPTDPTHLTKPGAIALLRLIFPQERTASGHGRRFLILNALLMVAGITLTAVALRRTAGKTSALLFLIVLLAVPQLRDAADYVASEAVAGGLVLLAFGALVLARAPKKHWAVLGGACIGLLLALRPNDGAVVIAVIALMAIGNREASRAWLRPAAIALAGSVIVIFAALYAAGYRSSPRVDATKTLLWGTLDYYWRPDAKDWPIGRTPDETAHLQWARIGDRWRSVIRDWSENQQRSLEWKALHGIVSSEELPPQWRGGGYQRFDRRVREWWWASAVILFSLSVLTAVAGHGAYRYVGLLVFVSLVLQSVLCGADPRLALPLLALLAAGLAGGLPLVRWSGAGIAAGAIVLVFLVWRVSRVPDAAGYDFAIAQGPSRQIVQELPPSSFPAGDRAQVQFRLNEELPYPLGFRASLDGIPILERVPYDSSPYPAFFSAPLTPAQLVRARIAGLKLSIESTGPPDREALLYFPLAPPIFGPHTRIDGDERLPSGFGGTATGSIPVWVTRTEASSGNQ